MREHERSFRRGLRPGHRARRAGDRPRAGDYAVKLYREGYPKGSVFAEAFIMSNLEGADFPSPRIHEVLLTGGRYGLRMDLVKGRTLSEELHDPAGREGAMERLVIIQCHLQQSYDLPWAIDIKLRFCDDLIRNQRLTDDRREKLLAKLGELPDGQALCHCDFHVYNVFFDDMDYTIIDLLQIGRGDPAESVERWLEVYAGTLLGQLPERYTPMIERFIDPAR